MTPIVCYFIQSHRDPEQIYRLVRTLRRGSARGRIVVQHNFAAGCDLDWSPVADLPDVHLFPASGPQIRSNFSCQVQPYLDLIDWLEREGLAYDWLVNLSAQDYPVTPVPAIEEFLGAATADAFIRYWDVLGPASPWSRRKARARYWHRYRLVPGAERALHAARVVTKFLPLHFYLDYGPWVGVRRLKTPFGAGFRCYGGWAWFSLRHAAVRFFREYLDAHPDFTAHYRDTKVPEESLVQTVLANSGRFDLVDDDFRYIDYSRAYKGAPRILTGADLPLFTTGKYHFARKFDYADPGVLDRIDSELLGIEPERAG
ncbi:MAG TPA: beta-1,6-N-acetylglucosaminyltransferase [Thermoanaerobaculia bacterium]|nr:beta-1,6-N-acetylglucosaminyltransferase [Thermoanaerobaculia bacterium]